MKRLTPTNSKIIVAASNAPTTVKNSADYVCTGTGDHTIINNALTALPAAGGTVELSAGTFTTSGTITLTAYQRLIGQGIGGTTITTSTNGLMIRMGNRQSDSTMRNAMLLSDLSVTQSAGTQTNTNVLIDGGGNETSIRNVISSGGKYGFELMDLDRCYFENSMATNQTTAGWFLEVGLENTWGTVSFLNCSGILSNNSTYAFLVDANAGQSSPNAPDRIGFINCHMFMTAGLTGCYGFYSKLQITATSFISCLFEYNNRHYRIDGSNYSVHFLGCSFIDPAAVATDAIYLNGYGHISVRDCRFQQVTNVFNGVSGFPVVMVEGTNNNQGSITNIWTGSYGYRGGTDALFTGDTNLVLGGSSNRYSTVYTAALANGSNSLALPTSADTLVGRNTTDTLTFKTLTAPVINNPTGFLTGAAKITVSTSTPSSPSVGDLWVDTN